MPQAKIAITLDAELVAQIDQWVRERKFPSRSKAIQTAVEERMATWRKIRLAEETAKLDPEDEVALSEEGLGADTWPEY